MKNVLLKKFIAETINSAHSNAAFFLGYGADEKIKKTIRKKRMLNVGNS